MMIRTAWLLLAIGCTSSSGGTDVGGMCELGVEPASASEIIIVPTTACDGAACLRLPPSRPLPPGSAYNPDLGLCSAACETDGDCERVPSSPCVTGFTCGIAVSVGPNCCQKFCICKDYVVVPDGGEVATPVACDAANADNACCNLPGRAGDAANYPLCPA